MNWWEWLLVSIIMYIGCGIITGLIEAYDAGRRGTRWCADAEDYGLTVCFWPLLVAVVTFMAPYKLCLWLNKRGGRHAERKQDRDERKQVQRQIAEIRVELGIK